MGTIYSVSCEYCKITRDLDKFYGSQHLFEETREAMLEFAEYLSEHGGWSFRSALLVDFMARHRGHKCVFFTEHDREDEDMYPNFEFDPENDNGYRFDVNYWEEQDNT